MPSSDRRPANQALLALMAAAAFAAGCGTPCGNDPDGKAAFAAFQPPLLELLA